MDELKDSRSRDQAPIGLDMAETIDWYKEKAGILLELIKDRTDIVGDSSPEIPTEDIDSLSLSANEIKKAIGVFPEAARNRSVLKGIKGKPPAWFSRESTGSKPVSTENPIDAISPTAIIPAYTDYSKWRKDSPAAEIWLYQMDNETVSPEVQKVILFEALVHEFAHTIITPILYSQDYRLHLPDGREVEGFDLLLEFAEAAEIHPAISHYASTYRGKGGKFEGDETYNLKTAINEELAETIAAHLLKFVFCEDENRRLDPLGDRPKVEKFIIDFLNAERV